MDIYNDNGYIDFDKIMNKKPYMVVMIGARGIGKTFGALDYTIRNNLVTTLVRRTQGEREFIRERLYNPYSALVNKNRMKEFEIESGKYSDKYFFIGEKKNPFAICVSVAGASKVRGIDGSFIDVIYYDEFIKDNNEKALSDEAGGFFQLIETINRNRELDGLPPVLVIMTANSNNIFNPICGKLKFTDIFLEMRKNNEETRFLKNKRVLLVDIQKSPISEKKKDTFLYRLTEGTDFYNMAINNKYHNDISDYIGSPFPLQEYKPFATVRDIHILRHSSNRLLYVTSKNRGTAKHIYHRWVDFLKEYNIFLDRCIRYGCLFFENMDIAAYFEDFL